jgi:hypothetical protein
MLFGANVKMWILAIIPAAFVIFWIALSIGAGMAEKKSRPDED